jgi:single-strand selective monofunctional uracil DNA glycosylase
MSTAGFPGASSEGSTVPGNAGPLPEGLTTIGRQLILGSRKLANALSLLRFSEPVTHIYNPLLYARQPHETYLARFARNRKRVVFLGMNPGPFGMVQTGIPFGEIDAVKGWLKVEAPVQKPGKEHPRRPVTGFKCRRSEVSGRRLWGLFEKQFGPAENFFQDHLVLNYCPLAFMEESGKNRTPDKLKPEERERVYALCDDYLRTAIEVLTPDWIIGVGDFAATRAREAVPHVRVVRILHPSPANPAANRNWAGIATLQLCEMGVWNKAT